MSVKKITVPASLKASSLSSLSKTAMTRGANIAAEVLFVDPEECYTVINPRKKFNQDLIDSYAEEFLDPAQGQREPCHVYPKDDKGYRMHHGATRRLAALKAKERKPDFKLKVIIDSELLNRSDAANYFEQGANNIKRDNMSVFDQADWIAESMELAKAEGVKLTLTEVAEKLAMSKSKVSRIYALRNAAPEIREIYDTRTQDPETLTNLVKIRETNPDLFTTLVNETELDRATVREAAKSGTLPKPEYPMIAGNGQPLIKTQDDSQTLSAQTTTSDSNGYDWSNFVAHAQQSPLDDLQLSTGNNVTIYQCKVEGGYMAAASTDFPSHKQLKLEDNHFSISGDAQAALNQAYLSLYHWSENLEKDTNLNEEQLSDIVLLGGFLRMRLAAVPGTTPPAPKREPKPKAKAKASCIQGTWEGQECVLVSDLSVLSSEELAAIGSSDMVYIDGLKGGRKLIHPEEFTLKGVKFKIED
ncbi:hypothetical protein C1N60_23425 (plasmid) [Pantoea sp. SGAir0184]